MKTYSKNMFRRMFATIIAFILTFGALSIPAFAAQDSSNDFIFTQDKTHVPTTGGTVNMTISVPSTTPYDCFFVGLNCIEAVETYGCTVTHAKGSSIPTWFEMFSDFYGRANRPNYFLGASDAGGCIPAPSDLLNFTVNVPAGLPDGTVINFTMNANAEAAYGKTSYFNEFDSTYKDDDKVVFSIVVADNAKFTLTYDVNGGTGATITDPSSPYSDNAKVTVLDDPGLTAPAGKVFTGWNTLVDGTGTHYDAGSTFNITKNTVLYADWKDARTVTYDLNGGSGSLIDGNSPYADGATVTVLPGTGLISPPGKSFTGWNTEADGTGTPYAAGATFKITADTTLYAQWEFKNLNLNYNVNGGTVTGTNPSTTHRYNTVVTVSDDSWFSAPTGRTFIGWNTAANGSGTDYSAGSTFAITTDTTLYAQWDYEWAVTYNLNGGTGAPITDSNNPYANSATVTVLSGTGLTAPTGKYFTGWNTEANGSGTHYAVGSTFTITANTTLYAEWDDLTYTLNYDVNGGGGSVTDPGSPYIYNTEVTVLGRTGLTDPTGKVFVGWNTLANGLGTDYKAGDKFNITADTILYAKWADARTLTYNANGGTGGPITDLNSPYADSATVTVLDGTALTAPSGKEFLCWNTAADGSGTDYNVGSTFTITADTTLYAKWADIGTVARVTFKVTNGTWADGTNTDKIVAVSLTGGTGTLAVADVPTGMIANSGYSGGSWSTTPNTATGGVTTDVTYTYSFTRTSSGGSSGSGGGGGGGTTSYTLKFDVNGGSSVSSVTRAKGTTISLTQTTTRDGYDFDGWYADSKLTEKVTKVTLNSNMTVYAKWVAEDGTEEPVSETINWSKGGDHYAYIFGYEDGTIRPNANISRAEVASIFYRVMTDESREENMSTSNNFTDVSRSDWYNTQVSTMARAGVIAGYTDGTFGGNRPITRAEFATIAARANGADGNYNGSSQFSDVSGGWAEDYINEAVEMGLISGYSDGTFRPNAYITRAEAISIMNRFLGRGSVDETSLIPGVTTLSDNSTSAWYYYSILEATNSHKCTIDDAGAEQWTEFL